MNIKKRLRQKRHRSILVKIHSQDKKPRLIVHRSLKHIRAEVVDDIKNKTLLSLSTQDKELKQGFVCSGNIKTAQVFGEVFVKRAKEKGITKIIFDRAGYLYHGRIKAFVEALRKGGLEF